MSVAVQQHLDTERGILWAKVSYEVSAEDLEREIKEMVARDARIKSVRLAPDTECKPKGAQR